MKTASPLFMLLLFLVTCFACERIPPAPSVEDVHAVILEPQKERYDQFTNLLQTMDTASALDLVLAEFEEDPNVKWAILDDDGIAVQYKNGIKGGMFIRKPYHSENPGIELLKSGYSLKMADEFLEINKTVPASKSAIFFAPCYTEFKDVSDVMIEHYRMYLPKIGFEPLEIYKDEYANLEKLADLSDYGIIHLSSHGKAWPSSKDIDNVFIEIGDDYSDAFYEEYKEDIMKGYLGILIYDDHNQVYAGADYIVENNNFKDDDQLMYGEFCYSSLGGWPKMMNKAGISGYFGFDWAVSSYWSAYWNLDLIKYLCNTNVVLANSTEDWMNTNISKFYWAKDYERNVNIDYEGLSDLSLFDPDAIEASYSKCILSLRVYGHIQKNEVFYGEDTTYTTSGRYMIEDLEYTGSFSGNTFTGSYDWHHDDIGTYDYDISITLNSDRDEIVSLTVTNIRTDDDSYTEVGVSAVSIPLIDPEGVYEVGGTETCTSLNSLSFYNEFDSRPVLDLTGTSTLTGYECNDLSYLTIEFE